jgi:hypothetical protein
MGLWALAAAYFQYIKITAAESIGAKPSLWWMSTWIYGLGGKWAVVNVDILIGIGLLFIAIRILASRKKQIGTTHGSSPTD